MASELTKLKIDESYLKEIVTRSHQKNIDIIYAHVEEDLKQLTSNSVVDLIRPRHAEYPTHLFRCTLLRCR